MVSLQHSWSDITATCTHFSRGLDLSLRLDRLPLDMCDCAQVSRNGLWCLRVERANTMDKLRDLELGNEVRVFARSLPCTASFVTGRDIIHNTTMLCRNLWAAHEEAVQGDDPYLLLAFGCSKGYNRMDHSWLQRCLRTASTPPEIPGPRWMPFGEPAGAHLGRCRICASSSGFRFAHKVAQHHACFSSLELIPSCLLCSKLIMFQVFLVSSMIGPWAAKACLLSLKFPIWYSCLRSNGHLVSQFGTVISASPFVNVCLVYTSVFMHPFMTCITTQSTSLIVALSVFGCVRTSLSLTMRVLVANIFMCTLFAYPNRHFFHAPVFCCKRLSAKLCGFWHQSHGPNWECSRQSAHCMALNYPFKIWGCPTSLVCCLLTKAGLTFIAVLSLRYVGGGDSTLIFPTLPSVGKLRLFFFRHTVGSTHSDVFERGWTKSTGTTFPFSVSAVGWCRIASLGNVSGTTRASQRLGWSNITPYTTAVAEERATSTQTVFAEGAPQCSHRTSKAGRSACRWWTFAVLFLFSLDHLPRCHTVFDVYDSIRVVADLPPIPDGLSHMLQERWEGGVVASIVAFFAAIWNVDVQAWCTLLLIRWIEGSGAGELAMSMAGALLPHSF